MNMDRFTTLAREIIIGSACLIAASVSIGIACFIAITISRM